MPPFLHLQPRLNVQATGRGTNASGLYRTTDPVDGLYMTWNGWEPGQVAPTKHAHFDSMAAGGAGIDVILAESIRTNASITASAQTPSQVFDYWQVSTGGDYTGDPADWGQARMGPEFVAPWPHLPAVGHFLYTWSPRDYVTHPGRWVCMQCEMMYSGAFYVDTNLYLGGSNLVQKVWNQRNRFNANWNGMKTRANSTYITEKIHEPYWRMHTPETDYQRAGENIFRQEPMAGESTNYPGWVGILRRNNQCGLDHRVIDQDRQNYVSADEFSPPDSPWLFRAQEPYMITVGTYLGGPTETRIRVDVASRTAGPFTIYESETTPGLGINRYPDPQEPDTYSSGGMIYEWDSSAKGTGITATLSQFASLGVPDGCSIYLRNVVVHERDDFMPTVRPML